MRIVPKRNDISLLKTSMMIAVVLYHSLLFFNGKWFSVVNPQISADYLSNIAKWLNTFHTQAFTMASGFLFYYLTNQRNSTITNIKKRSKRLLLPYLFVSLLWTIPIGCYLFGWPIKEVVERYLLAINPNQLWFLIMLFLVYIFFELIGKKIKISTRNLIITYIITTITYIVLSQLKIIYFQLHVVAQYILYFYLGGYIFHKKKKITKKQTIIMLILAIAMYITTLHIDASSAKILYYAGVTIMPIISVLEISIIYYICAKLIEKKKVNIKSKAYKILEENSFGIYLFHQQIIYFTILIFNGTVHPVLQAMLSFTISLTASLMITLALKKWKTTKSMFWL